MLILLNIDFSLPLENPVLRFLIILLIILIVPVVFNRIKIPSILGLILAGAIIGPHAFNLMQRDSGIILSGTAGLLYIMFLAGLEVDMGDFKKNRLKSIVFGLYTFCIPMILGILGSLYLLNFSLTTSVLLASMFASHTLIAYPIIRKLGITRNIAVNITVGGTIITDTLALLVLAVIVGLSKGEVGTLFWIQLAVSVLLFGFVVLFIFPLIGKWVFKRIEDSVAQYVFVLAMVFLAAFLAELAGVEGIIGAFLAGLSLNRLIPRNSELMHRVEFVGNAIFIPFFLIGIGMLIDYKLFFDDLDTLKVGAIMILIATVSKYLAAVLTQKTFSLTKAEGQLIFGLSNAQAAATLAAVIIGYNIVLGEDISGEPIRLLNENVLNGTILMILFTCTMATFSATKGAKGVLVSLVGSNDEEDLAHQERILIPLRNIKNVEELISLAILMKSTPKTDLFALSVLNNKTGSEVDERTAQQVLTRASQLAMASDHAINSILRYDTDFANGILSVVKENQITDVLLGLHIKKKLSDSFLGELTEMLLNKIHANTFVYKSFQSFKQIDRHVIILPEGVENETGFPSFLNKIWKLGKNSEAKLRFYGSERCLVILKKIHQEYPLDAEFIPKHAHADIEEIIRAIKPNENLIMVFKLRKDPMQLEKTESLVGVLNELKTNSFILAYVYNDNAIDANKYSLMDASVIGPVQKIDELFRQVSENFTRSGH